MDKKVVEGFKRDFLAIKQKGFVPSTRTHDTGIGKTFEDLVGIHENNNYLADYKDELEIKSSRDLSESMVTLFTKSPSHPLKANSFIREHYGKPDSDFTAVKIVHSTVSATNFNTFENKWGFKINVSEQLGLISLIIKNLKTAEVNDSQIYFTFDDLKERVEKKCKHVAYVSAEPKKENGKEFFKFNKAVLLSGLTFQKFVDCVKKGLIVYDIRLGIYRSGKMKGKPHDHGSGFRVLKRNVDKVFDVQEL
ncbi:MvaI/BcnI restriction endonuclease family protein [Candidatus Woesearchaeota archaeon]|nr:MvaI/BcnI restriction endonuclease family protein [Candidatus Woesearchaeota archaeon]